MSDQRNINAMLVDGENMFFNAKEYSSIINFKKFHDYFEDNFDANAFEYVTKTSNPALVHNIKMAGFKHILSKEGDRDKAKNHDDLTLINILKKYLSDKRVANIYILSGDGIYFDAVKTFFNENPNSEVKVHVVSIHSMRNGIYDRSELITVHNIDDFAHEIFDESDKEEKYHKYDIAIDCLIVNTEEIGKVLPAIDKILDCKKTLAFGMLEGNISIRITSIVSMNVVEYTDLMQSICECIKQYPAVKSFMVNEL